MPVAGTPALLAEIPLSTASPLSHGCRSCPQRRLNYSKDGIDAY